MKEGYKLNHLGSKTQSLNVNRQGVEEQLLTS